VVEFNSLWKDSAGGSSIANNFTVGATGYGGIVQLGSGLSTTGSVRLVNGRLDVRDDGGSLVAGSGIVINGVDAELRYNGTSPLTSALSLVQGTISGTGTIATAVTIGADDFLSPGNSPGIQPYTSVLTWAPQGTYEWELNALLGTAGTTWDLVDVTGGTFNLSGLSAGGKFVLDLITLAADNTSGPLALPYVTGSSYTFAIASYNPAAFSLPTGFSTAAGTDLTSLFQFSLANWQGNQPVTSDLSVKINDAGNGLNLVIVPEPGALALAGVGIAAAAWALRRRRRK
jgi:hypothetical protein